MFGSGAAWNIRRLRGPRSRYCLDYSNSTNSHVCGCGFPVNATWEDTTGRWAADHVTECGPDGDEYGRGYIRFEIYNAEEARMAMEWQAREDQAAAMREREMELQQQVLALREEQARLGTALESLLDRMKRVFPVGRVVVFRRTDRPQDEYRAQVITYMHMGHWPVAIVCTVEPYGVPFQYNIAFYDRIYEVLDVREPTDAERMTP